MPEALSPAARPSRTHTTVALGLLAWLVVMLGLLAWALMLRVLQCGSHRDLGWLLNHLCSFRGLGSAVLFIDAVLMGTLIWQTAQYDTEPRTAARGLGRPAAAFSASVRALRHKHTPHRLKHRFSFWVLMLLVLAFSYLVVFSPFLFW
jgi:hypothetical protein